MLGLCCIGGGMVRWRIFGTAADSPLTIHCMRRFDCWNSWAIVSRSARRCVVWWTIVAVIASSLWSVWVGVYCCGEGTKLLIKLVLEVLHGLSEEFFW